MQELNREANTLSSKSQDLPRSVRRVAGLVLALWWLRVDTTHIWLDIAAATVGYAFALKFAFTTQWNSWIVRERPSLLMGVAAFLGSSWLALGLFDVLFGPSAGEYVELKSPAGFNQSNPSGKKVGLALSGGGYRAALFHAGVVFELQKQAVPVDIVSSVSGGSIFAAALHSGVSPREFVKIVVDGRLNLARALASPTYVLPALTDAIIPRLQRGAWKYARDRSRRSENARLIERAFGQTKVFGLLRRICGSTTNDSEGSGSTLFFLRAREE